MNKIEWGDTELKSHETGTILTSEMSLSPCDTDKCLQEIT